MITIKIEVSNYSEILATLDEIEESANAKKSNKLIEALENYEQGEFIVNDALLAFIGNF